MYSYKTGRHDYDAILTYLQDHKKTKKQKKTAYLVLINNNCNLMSLTLNIIYEKNILIMY